ncbi:MAG: hypothetical protein Q7J84_06420 [Sulfuricaulis sp.]|nr:hypothetical protein [Sulfuricaulis sp.]
MNAVTSQWRYLNEAITRHSCSEQPMLFMSSLDGSGLNPTGLAWKPAASDASNKMRASWRRTRAWTMAQVHPRQQVGAAGLRHHGAY